MDVKAKIGNDDVNLYACAGCGSVIAFGPKANLKDEKCKCGASGAVRWLPVVLSVAAPVAAPAFVPPLVRAEPESPKVEVPKPVYKKKEEDDLEALPKKVPAKGK